MVCGGRLVGALLASLFVGLLPQPARACVLATPVPEPFVPDGSGGDSEPPVIHDVIAHVTRGDPDSSCSGLAFITLVVYASDDRSSSDELLYRLERRVGGEWRFYYDEPVSWLALAVPDHRGDIELDYRVYALDAAGNQSKPFEVGGSEPKESGCSVASAPGSRSGDGGWWFGGLASSVGAACAAG